jgi:hypothetical protein
MSNGRHHRVDDPLDELRHDRAFERRVLWKGIVALALVVVVVLVRHFYFL